MGHENRLGPTFSNALVALGTHPCVALLRTLEGGSQQLSILAAENPTLTEAALAAMLRELDADGLIARRVDPGPPLRVLYELTERGKHLAPALGIIAKRVREAP
jgi:DNA-binding HxlR family transcriptional regulator